TRIEYMDVTSGGCATNSCQTYSGPPTCISTGFDVSCAIRTSNVMLCRGVACDGICVPFSPCEFQLPRGFCGAPLTRSILVMS
ncbi:hypothetical protein C8R44DRAFT_645652, partial [Mycena epipterygia]